MWNLRNNLAVLKTQSPITSFEIMLFFKGIDHMAASNGIKLWPCLMYVQHLWEAHAASNLDNIQS